MPSYGGVLAALPMLLREGLLGAANRLFRLPAGFHGLTTILTAAANHAPATHGGVSGPRQYLRQESALPRAGAVQRSALRGRLPARRRHTCAAAPVRDRSGSRFSSPGSGYPDSGCGWSHDGNRNSRNVARTAPQNSRRDPNPARTC